MKEKDKIKPTRVMVEKVIYEFLIQQQQEFERMNENE